MARPSVLLAVALAGLAGCAHAFTASIPSTSIASLSATPRTPRLRLRRPAGAAGEEGPEGGAGAKPLWTPLEEMKAREEAAAAAAASAMPLPKVSPEKKRRWRGGSLGVSMVSMPEMPSRISVLPKLGAVSFSFSFSFFKWFLDAHGRPTSRLASFDNNLERTHGFRHPCRILAPAAPQHEAHRLISV